MTGKNQYRKIFAREAFYMLLLLLGIISNTMGQLNTLDTTRLIVKLSCSGSLLDGNVSRLLLVNRLDVNYAKKKWGFSNRTDYQYGKKNSTLSENDLVVYDFLYYRPARRVYPFIMTILETNYRRKIMFRFQAGAGGSYNIIKKNSNLLRVSLTTTYERTRYDGVKFENVADTGSNILTAFRVIPRIFGVYKLFDNKVNLSYELWWQQSVSSLANHRIFIEQGLEIALIRHMDIKTNVRYTHENIRLKALKAYDLFFVFGVVVKNFK